MLVINKDNKSSSFLQFRASVLVIYYFLLNISCLNLTDSDKLHIFIKEKIYKNNFSFFPSDPQSKVPILIWLQNISIYHLLHSDLEAGKMGKK